MGNSSLIISFLGGVAIFVFIIIIASVQYDKEKSRKREQHKNENDWLFHDFYLKVYGALFNNTDPDLIAIKIGIKIEKYYQSCKLTKTVPNPKKLIVNHIYGFAILLLSFFFAIMWKPVILLFGITLFFIFVYYEQTRLNQKAEAMKVEITNDLPRFLDLLAPELNVGLPAETAIYILCTKYDSLLSREFLDAMNETKIGLNGWQQALEKIAAKYDVDILSNFVLDVSTAYNKGVPIADSVERKASDIKTSYLLNVKERAGKSTNTILIPIAILQFIPLLIFLLLPALVQVTSGM